MRLFITSYQKSGTHQIMPMFNGTMPDVVNRGHQEWTTAPSRFQLNREINWEGVEETIQNLRFFRGSSNKAFGHVAYLPEYAQVLEETETRVIFNFRDPRDVIVAEFENAKRMKRKSPNDSPLWNFFDVDAGKRIFEKDDPIPDLIELAAARWYHWLGWLDHDFVMPLKYEDMRLNPQETAEKLFEWTKEIVGKDVDALMRGAIPRPANPTFRRGIPGEWKEQFTYEHKEIARELLSDIIIKLGYTV